MRFGQTFGDFSVVVEDNSRAVGDSAYFGVFRIPNLKLEYQDLGNVRETLAAVLEEPAN